MGEFNIKVEANGIAHFIYVTPDGKKFTNIQDAYKHIQRLSIS